jgi:hypothetical protein
MRGLVATIVFVVATGAAAAGAPAASLDGSAPILCALTSVVECSQKGDCKRSSAESAEVPGFLRVNVAGREVSSVDGQRTSPIAKVDRADGRLMLQGVQNARVWGAVIEEHNGQLGATVSEPDGAIVISGSCIAP